MSLDMPMQAASRYMTDKGADLQGAKRRERQTGVAICSQLAPCCQTF